MTAQHVQPIDYGPRSPFSPDEREIIDAIYREVLASQHPQAEQLRQTIREQAACLDSSERLSPGIPRRWANSVSGSESAA